MLGLPIGGLGVALSDAGMLVASETLAAINAYFMMDQAAPTSCPASNERTSNQYHMLALDHMIRETTGLPLSDALPLRQHKLLQRGERRYFSPVAAVEDSRGTVQLGRRACIYNADTNMSCFEYPRLIDADGTPADLTVYVVADQGPKGWRAWMRLFVGMGARGWVLTDPWHIGWFATRQAATDTGLWLLVLELTV